MNQLLIIAHVPLASALLESVLHVFPDAKNWVSVVDVLPNDAPETTQHKITQLCSTWPVAVQSVLVLADVCGATPCNIAQNCLAQRRNMAVHVVAGVNLPMLLRACTYRHETLDVLLAKAISGGMQGVVALS